MEKKTLTEVEMRKEIRLQLKELIKKYDTKDKKYLSNFDALCASYERTINAILTKVNNFKPSVNQVLKQYGYTNGIEHILNYGESAQDNCPVEKEEKKPVKKPVKKEAEKNPKDDIPEAEKLDREFEEWLKYHRIEKVQKGVKKILYKKFIEEKMKQDKEATKAKIKKNMQKK